MRTEYGREVDRNSISPQLARLRQDRAVEQTGGAADPKWKTTGADQNVDLKDEEPEPEGSGLLLRTRRGCFERDAPQGDERGYF